MKRLLLFAAVTVLCLAQTPSPPAAISAYYRLAGNTAGPFPYQWLLIDAPLTLSFDGKSPHLGIAGPRGPAGIVVESGGLAIGNATTLDIEAGVGFSCVPQVSAGVMTLQCNADPAVVAYRVAPPTASGPCVDPMTGKPFGAGAWATDNTYFYVCVPGPAGLIWGRSALTTGW